MNASTTAFQSIKAKRQEKSELLRLKKVSPIIRYSVPAIRNLIADGRFPIETVKMGGQRLAVKESLINYLALKLAQELLEAKQPAKKSGRPRNQPKHGQGVNHV